MPKSMSCVHIATARSRGHLPFNSSSFSFLFFALNSCLRLKSSKTMCGIRCNFGIASAKAARSISRDGEFELAMSSDSSSSDLRIDDSERRPLNTSHAATKSTTRDVFVVPAVIVSFVVFSSFLSSFVSLFASKSAEDEDEIRRLRRRFPVARSRCSRRDGRSFVLLFDETFAREHERTFEEVIFLGL